MSSVRNPDGAPRRTSRLARATMVFAAMVAGLMGDTRGLAQGAVPTTAGVTIDDPSDEKVKVRGFISDMQNLKAATTPVPAPVETERMSPEVPVGLDLPPLAERTPTPAPAIPPQPTAAASVPAATGSIATSSVPAKPPGVKASVDKALEAARRASGAAAATAGLKSPKAATPAATPTQRVTAKSSVGAPIPAKPSLPPAALATSDTRKPVLEDSGPTDRAKAQTPQALAAQRAKASAAQAISDRSDRAPSIKSGAVATASEPAGSTRRDVTLSGKVVRVLNRPDGSFTALLEEVDGPALLGDRVQAVVRAGERGSASALRREGSRVRVRGTRVGAGTEGAVVEVDSAAAPGAKTAEAGSDRRTAKAPKAKVRSIPEDDCEDEEIDMPIRGFAGPRPSVVALGRGPAGYRVNGPGPFHPGFGPGAGPGFGPGFGPGGPRGFHGRGPAGPYPMF